MSGAVVIGRHRPPPTVAARPAWPAGDPLARLMTAAVAVLACAGPVIGFRSMVAAATALGFMAAGLGIWRPQLGLIGLGLLCTADAPARDLLMTGGLLRWNTLNYWLLAVAVLFLPLVARVRNAATNSLLLLLICLGVGLLFSAAPMEGIQHMIPAAAFFGLLAYWWRVPARGDAWYWTAVTCGVFGAGASLAYYTDPVIAFVMNANAWSYVPNTALFTIVLVFPFASRGWRRQEVLGTLAAINAASAFLSGSRGGLLLALLSSTALVITTRGLASRMTQVAIVAAVVLGASTMFTGLQEHTVHRVRKLLDPGSSLSGRTSGRSELVLAGLHIFEQRPLGVGTGGFATAWQQIGPRDVPGLSAWRRGRPTQAHSAWIKTLAENGVPGILLLAAFVTSFAWMGFRKGPGPARRIGVITSLIIAVAFTTAEFQSRGIWLLAAGTAALLCMPVRPYGHGRPAGSPVDTT